MSNVRSYEDKCHFIGRITVLAAFLGTLLFPVTLILFLDIPADWKVMIGAAVSILVIQTPSAFSQFISYAPVVGPSAMYMMVVTGNFSNMKIPAVIAAKEAVGLDQTDESVASDVVSTIAMATSTMVCEIILIIGVLLMSQLAGLLSNPVLKPAFANIGPAVFGALFMVLAVKAPKLAIAPVITSVLFILFTNVSSSLTMPICLIVALISADFMYKRGWLTPKKGADAPKKEEQTC